MKPHIYIMLITLLLACGNSKAITVGQIFDLYNKGEEGKASAKIYVAGIAEGMLYTNGWNAAIADKVYAVKDFEGVCFPDEQSINGDYLINILVAHMMSTIQKEGLEAATLLKEKELVFVLIDILSAQNCPVRMRSK